MWTPHARMRTRTLATLADSIASASATHAHRHTPVTPLPLRTLATRLAPAATAAITVAMTAMVAPGTAVSLVPVRSSRLRIFSRDYCASLLRCPLLRVQTTVAFEGDVPDRDAPEQPLGVAIKALYDGAVMGRTAALAEHAVAPLLGQLQAALDALPADQRALLPPFTYVHYARAMALRAAAHPDHQTEELGGDPKKQGYWGSNRQLMFGKVAADVFDRNVAGTSAAFAPLHPLTAVLASPTGGIIGPGTHNHWPELLGGAVYSRAVLNYHAVCHDASGYCRSALNLGPGYQYSPTGWNFLRRCLHACCCCCCIIVCDRAANPALDPLAGQFDGLAMWEDILKKK